MLLLRRTGLSAGAVLAGPYRLCRVIVQKPPSLREPLEAVNGTLFSRSITLTSCVWN